MVEPIMCQNVEEISLDPEEQLTRDWAMFQAVEAGASGSRSRCWETTGPVVVVGRTSRIDEDVILDACREDGVPVVRRFSGGGAVVLGPGCLNYAVALSLVSRPELRHVRASFQFILGRIVAALAIPGLSVAGETDLALALRKVSGNAQRRGRRALLHHGTLLYGFDPGLASRYLREPARQPAYRAGRDHAEFIGTIPLSAEVIRTRLDGAWDDVGHRAPGPGRAGPGHTQNDGDVPDSARVVLKSPPARRSGTPPAW
jgi:lipoate-protein ligase A